MAVPVSAERNRAVIAAGSATKTVNPEVPAAMGVVVRMPDMGRLNIGVVSRLGNDGDALRDAGAGRGDDRAPSEQQG